MRPNGQAYTYDAATDNRYARTAGNKQYEFGNHLGNVLVTVSDRHLQVDDGVYAYAGGTVSQTSPTPDGRLDYYLPDVLTATDYYPGGMPMPGRTQQGTACSTQTAVTTATLRNDPFNSGTASYTGTNGAVLGNASGTLLVTKSGPATGLWAARTPAHTFATGVYYELSYLLAPGACSAGREVTGWRVVDASGATVSDNSVGGGNVYGTFTVPADGTYYIEFYRNTSSTGACSFTIDNVLLTYNTYVHTTACGTPTPADQYLWGHNGQYKDDEIYGTGNTYTAEYWEYDSRLLRRWNVDPLTDEWQSSYAAFNNNPIYYSDPLGLKGEKGDGKGKGEKKPQRNKKNTTGKWETKNPDGTLTGVPADPVESRPYTVYSGDEPQEPAPEPKPAPKPAPAEQVPQSTGQEDYIQQGVTFIMEFHPAIQVAQGRYWDAAGSLFPAFKIAFDGYAAPTKIVNDLINGQTKRAAFTYGEHVISGASLMLGIRAARPNTEAIKKVFTRAVPETGEVLAGEIVEEAAKGGTQVIKGFTQHAAAESAITRGFKTADILKIGREGTQEVIRNGTQIRYTLQSNSIVVQQTGRNAGKVVTVFSNAPGTANGLGKGFFILWK